MTTAETRRKTTAAKAPVTSTSAAVSERQGIGWNRCSAEKTGCNERDRNLA